MTNSELMIAAMQRARRRRRELDQETGRITGLRARDSELRDKISDLQEKIVLLDKVTALLNSLGEDRQEQAQRTIEALVSQGLQTIFDPSLSFHIITTVKGKTTTAEFVVRTTLADTVIETGVMESRGGGLVAVISFLLRLTVMLLTHGRDNNNLLVLDESFAHVSEEYLDTVGTFLQELSTKTGVQIILVTHQQELIPFGDVVYRFRTDESGATIVTEQR